MGVNRLEIGIFGSLQNIPLTRGDEPDKLFRDGQSYVVYPTCVGVNRCRKLTRTIRMRNPTTVGMNRTVSHRSRRVQSIPHVRGDEPAAPPSLLSLRIVTPRLWG